jgi:toxin HigB-1
VTLFRPTVEAQPVGRTAARHRENVDAIRSAYYISAFRYSPSNPGTPSACFEVRQFEGLAAAAERKLLMVDRAMSLQDLRGIPGNRLEELAGDRKGQHSIRINAQWRVCFVWGAQGPEDVEIVDYH